jgi:hypothetical protein
MAVVISLLVFYNTMAKRQRTNNDQQSNTQKTKDLGILTPLKTGEELNCSRRIRVGSSCTCTNGMAPV